MMRERGCPIVWVRQEFQADLSDAFLEVRAKGISITIKGTPGCQIIPELPIRPSEIVIVKKRYSAFFGPLFARKDRQGHDQRRDSRGYGRPYCLNARPSAERPAR
jgi:nicotinamidase-related amidase